MQKAKKDTANQRTAPAGETRQRESVLLYIEYSTMLITTLVFDRGLPSSTFIRTSALYEI